MERLKEEFRKLKKFPPLKRIFRKDNFKRYTKKVLNLKDNPRKTAFSTALGVFIGFFIPIGLQTFFIVPLSLLSQSNILLAYASTFVSNPLTALPIYYSAFHIGSFLTGKSISWVYISETLTNPTISNLLSLGWESASVFIVGAFIQAAVFSTASYFLSLKAVRIYRQKKEKRKIKKTNPPPADSE